MSHFAQNISTEKAQKYSFHLTHQATVLPSYRKNHLTGFYIWATLALNRLSITNLKILHTKSNKNTHKSSKTFTIATMDLSLPEIFEHCLHLIASTFTLPGNRVNTKH